MTITQIKCRLCRLIISKSRSFSPRYRTTASPSHTVLPHLVYTDPAYDELPGNPSDPGAPGAPVTPATPGNPLAPVAPGGPSSPGSPTVLVPGNPL